MTSPVREKVDLMKFQVMLLRVAAPQKRVVSSCGTASLRDTILRVTLKARSVRDGQEWHLGKGVQTQDGTLLSLFPEAVLTVQKIQEVSQKRLPRETGSCAEDLR